MAAAVAVAVARGKLGALGIRLGVGFRGFSPSPARAPKFIRPRERRALAAGRPSALGGSAAAVGFLAAENLARVRQVWAAMPDGPSGGYF